MASSDTVPLTWFYITPVSPTTAANIGASRFSIVIGDKSTARRTFLADMKSNGFVGLSLHYIVQAQVQNPLGGTPYSNQWTYNATDWANDINVDETMFLHCGTPASSSNRITSSTNWYYMDPGSANWRTWVATRAGVMQAAGYFDYDGIFLDNVPLTWNKELAAAEAQGDTLRNGAGVAYSEATYLAAELGFLSAIRTAVGADPLWGNMIRGVNDGSEWTDSMTYLDGGMHEGAVGWDASYLSTSQQDGVLTQLDWCTANGKGFIFVGLGADTNNAKELYALATYLMVRPDNSTPISTPYTAFRYTKTTEYQYWREYANLLVALGDPLGARTARTDGTVGWTRNFDNGTAKTDETNHLGEITLGEIVDEPMVSTAVSTSLTNTLAVNVPAGVIDGDMMILHVSTREDGQTISTPAGWTAVDNDSEAGTTPDTFGAIFSRIASSEPASYTVTVGTNAAIALVLIAVRGAVGVDVTGKNKSGAAVTSSTTNSITTTYANDIILQITTIHGASTGVTADASTVEEVDIEATAGTTNDVSAHVASFTQAAIGATGSKTITIAAARYTINFMVALYPAQPTPPTPGTGGLIHLTRNISMLDIKDNIEADAANLEESRFAYSQDTEELGLYSGGSWVWVGNHPGWDDLRVAAMATRVGATAPTLGAFGPSGNLKILRFEQSHHDEVHFEIQMPHSWRAGTNIFPHIHWTPVSATEGLVVWELEYAWANIDGTYGAPSNMNTQATYAGGVAWVHKMTAFYDFTVGPPYLNYISGAGKTASSMLVCRLHRNAGAASDTLAADAGFLEFDFHYMVDSLGSYSIT